MTTRRVSVRVPVRPPLAAAVAASALFLVGCTSTDDAWGSPIDDPRQDGATIADGSAGELAQDGMIFRDPADAGDFAPVEPDLASDVDPEAIPEVDAPVLDGPADVVAPIAEALASSAPGGDSEADGEGDGGGAAPAVAILDRVDAVDEGPAPDEVVQDRDGNRRNELGELMALDEAAGLACADVEAALTALDEGDGAAARDRMTAAAGRAGASGVEAINGWSATLAGAAATEEGTPEMVGFLSACAQGGYEL